MREPAGKRPQSRKAISILDWPAIISQKWLLWQANFLSTLSMHGFEYDHSDCAHETEEITEARCFRAGEDLSNS
jgi:hypothetical protein